MQTAVQTRNLRENQLGGVIFGCKHETIEECFSKQLFGLPALHYSYVRNVKAGLPLFLFNYTDRRLHGVFEAASPGQNSIDPYAWSNDGTLRTPFPAQVRICTKTRYLPLLEGQYKKVIQDNYYTSHYFYFELDHAQTRALIALFKSVGAKQVPAVPSKRSLGVPVPSTRRMTSLIPNQEKGTANSKGINSFGVLSSSLPSTKRMASVIHNQKKGTANSKDINPFSVLSSSGGIVPDDSVDSDADSGSVSATSDSNTDEKASGELVSDWEDLDDNDLQHQSGLSSNPDDVSQHSSYKTVAEGMELMQCNQLVVNPVNGGSHISDEDMLVNSHDGIGNEVQNEPDDVGVQPERSSILKKLKELFDLRQQAALSSQDFAYTRGPHLTSTLPLTHQEGPPALRPIPHFFPFRTPTLSSYSHFGGSGGGMGAAARPVRTRRPSRRAAEAAGGLIPSAASRAASTKRPGRSAHQAEAPAVVGMASADTEAAVRSASRSCRAKRRRSPSSPRRPKDKKKTSLLRSHHPLTLDPCSNRGGKLASSKLLKQGKLPGAKRARSTYLLPCLPDNNKLKNRNNLHDDAMESIVDCARTDLAICPPDNNRRGCENNLLDYPVCPPDNNIWRDLVNNLLADVAPAAKRVPDSQVDHPPCPPDTNNNWRDWANLADGPAGLIAERVLAYDIADYVRFRAVCRPWRQSSTEPRSHSGLDRRFHPWKWAMLREELAAPDRRSFLNTSTGQCVQVDIPELRDHDLLALTPEGLLVLVHKPQRSTVRLLNPLTRQLTELPPLTTLLPPNKHNNLSQHDIHTYCQAWGSGIASDDSTVVLCFNRLCMLGMAKPGDHHWTVLNYNGDGVTTASLMFAGRFYCVNLSGVMALEMGTDQPPRLKAAAKLSMSVSPMADSVHLVNNYGELMLVHRQLGPQKARNKSGRTYNIYRVDLDTGTLFPVKSLGGSAGRAVFMGMRFSLLVSLECFPSGSICADTIYLSFDVSERHQCRARAYHLIDGSMERTSRNWGGLVPRPYTLADCLSYAVERL